MDEKAFLDLADAELARMESAIEVAADSADADIDIELQAGGILELSFENGSKMIINRHAAAREIWVAAKSGGFHFKPDGGRWINTRDGEEIYDALSRLISQQTGTALIVKAR